MEEHPTVTAYKELVAQRDNLIKLVEVARSNLEKAREEDPVPTRLYKMGSIQVDDFEGPDVIRFILPLANRSQIEAWAKRWGSANDEVKPFLTNSYRFSPSLNAIIRVGGGNVFLRLDGNAFAKQIPCSATEWEEILKGNIPERMRPDWFVSE